MRKRGLAAAGVTSFGREGGREGNPPVVRDGAHRAVKKTIKSKSRFSRCNKLEKSRIAKDNIS